MPKPFQLTIIGTRYPQLALGTLMAKRGKRVLILDQRESAEVAGTRSAGYRFPKRPVPLFGLDSEGLLRRFLDEIGIGQILVRRSYPANPVSYQVILPRHRVNVYPKREKLLAEIEREMPDSADRLQNLYGELDELADEWSGGLDDLETLQGAWPRMGKLVNRLQAAMQAKKLTSVGSRFARGSPEADFLSIQQYFLGATPLDGEPDILSAALIHRVGRRGTFREPTGTGALTTLMATRCAEYGGIIKYGAAARSVERHSRNGLTVTLADGQKVDTAALATTDDVALTLAGLEGAVNGPRRSGGSRLHPVRFFLGIDENHIPAGMEDNLFMLRSDAGGPLGLRALYLALGPAGSDTAPEGKRALTVTALADPSPLTALTDDFIREVGDDLLRALHDVIPFLDEGLDYFDHELASGGAMKIPRPLGSGFVTWNPALVGRSRINLALKGRAAVMTTSPWELGLEGETIAALAAAGALRKILSRD